MTRRGARGLARRGRAEDGQMQIAAHTADLASSGPDAGSSRAGCRAAPLWLSALRETPDRSWTCPGRTRISTGASFSPSASVIPFAHDVKGVVGHPAPNKHYDTRAACDAGTTTGGWSIHCRRQAGQALPSKVEAPGGIKAAGLPLRGDEIEHRGPAFGIVGRGHHANGFVQQQVAGGSG